MQEGVVRLDAQALTQAIIDQVDEGILYLDAERRFRYANRRARQIIGITPESPAGHPAGKVQPGDILIIADNKLGDDDGGTTPAELERIGLKDPYLAAGDMLIAVGVYQSPKIKPVYKHLHQPGPGSALELEAEYLGFAIRAAIDPVDLRMDIGVNGQCYTMGYFQSIGHLVVVDGLSGQVKFFQARGYTVRRETLGGLLRGDPYAAKGESAEEIELIGAALTDIMEAGEFTAAIDGLFARGGPAVNDQFFDINKRLTLCSLIPVKGAAGLDGVILKMQEASGLESLMEGRNQLLEQIENRHSRVAAAEAYARQDFIRDFAGNSPAMREVKYLAWRAAKGRFNVLITGESGTGKSRLAQEIHKLQNPDGPFVEVNCASVPAGLFESELFGYVGGAFTGALAGGRAGYFEQAQGGTIFLDEIGEVPVDIQVKLLQVLQTKRFYRVGSEKPVEVDLRVIAATNVQLAQAVEEGRFRQDLYYRLNVFPIWIPPLRERKSDLYIMINHLLRQLCKEYGTGEKQMSAMALNRMLQYSWPGNVREMRNVLERAIAISDADTIFPEHINIPGAAGGAQSGQTLKSMLEAVEKQALADALQRCGGNKAKAMEALEVSKSVFYDKLKKYGL